MKKHEIEINGKLVTIYQDDKIFFAIGLKQSYNSLESCKRAIKYGEYDESDEEEEYCPHDEDWNDYQDYDNGLTYREQCYSDRSDYANERLRRGEIDEEQAAEIRAGA